MTEPAFVRPSYPQISPRAGEPFQPVCSLCGAVVWNTTKHDEDHAARWALHLRLAVLEERLSPPEGKAEEASASAHDTWVEDWARRLEALASIARAVR